MLFPRLIGQICRRVGESLSWLFLVAVLLTAFEVVMRYGVNAPTIWVHDLVIALTAICFIFGGAYSLQRREHIRISSLYQAMPKGYRRAVDRVIAVLTVVYLAFLGYAATRQAIPSLELMETSGRAWDVPIPPVIKTLFAVGVLLMLLEALVQLGDKDDRS
jgi:TRAP-type mannitol/chloroaromatic compound transport system permease small subunit